MTTFRKRQRTCFVFDLLWQLGGWSVSHPMSRTLLHAGWGRVWGGKRGVREGLGRGWGEVGERLGRGRGGVREGLDKGQGRVRGGLGKG